jgi:hypothetical protein
LKYTQTLGVKMLGKCFTTESYPQPYLLGFVNVANNNGTSYGSGDYVAIRKSLHV